MTTSAVLPHMKDAQQRSPSRKQFTRRRRSFHRFDRRENLIAGERLREWPMERMKTIVAAILLFASSLSTSFAVSFLNEVVPRNQPLPDVVFRLVPIQEWAWPVSDVLVVIMANVCGWSMLLHRYRWILLRRIFLIASVLYFFRSVSMLVTWVPLSDPSMLSKCITPAWMRAAAASKGQHDAAAGAISSESTPLPSTTVSSIPSWSLIGFRMWRYGISLGILDLESDRVLCGDYIYSGHTLMYVLTTLTMRTYMPRTGFYRLLRLLYPIAAACGMLFVVISRLHYTIDVIVAYWMTTLTFWCYHLLIALPRASSHGRRPADVETGELTVMVPLDDQDEEETSEEENGYGGYDGRRGLSFALFGSSYILDYFEKNVPAGVPLPRELNWPFSRPAWVCRFVNGLNEESILSSDD